MIVGHEPDLSSLVSMFLGGFSRDMLKAMVVGLHARDGQTQLRFVLDPKALKLDRDQDAG
jgi:hypothetical protein